MCVYISRIFPRDISLFLGDCIATANIKLTLRMLSAFVDSAYKADLKSELGCRGSIEISFVFDVRVFVGVPPPLPPPRILDEMCSSQSFAERGKFGEDDCQAKTPSSEIVSVDINRITLSES